MDRPHIEDVISLSFRHGQRTELLSCGKNGRVNLWQLVLLQGELGLHQLHLLLPRGCDQQGPGPVHPVRPDHPPLRQLHWCRRVCPQRGLHSQRRLTAQDLPLLHQLLRAYEEGGAQGGGQAKEYSSGGTVVLN